MTAPAVRVSPILISKLSSLEALQEPQRAVVRHVLLDAIGGLDRTHDSRWRRFVNRLLNAAPGEVFELARVVQRSGQFHRRHMSLEQRLFDHQERWDSPLPMRDWLKTGAGWVDWHPLPDGGIAATPRSTSYERCSDDEMREVHASMLAFLRTAHAQSFLWPHLSAPAQSEMLDHVLADREPQRVEG